MTRPANSGNGQGQSAGSVAAVAADDVSLRARTGTNGSSVATPTLDPATDGENRSIEVGPSPSAPARAESNEAGNAPSGNFVAPQKIGPYKLLEVIGEGGFGTVYIAEQQAPVRRRVALKIIKPGMDSRTVVARFEQERQALAIMDHPNIAKVFDAGTAPDGRPYFVMEYVAGEPITAYCDRNRLNVRQRLELFITACEAVQHAHHKGIIHRDIKPTNVMVTSAPGASGGAGGAGDSGAVVKVIDFGVAKAVSHILTDKTLFTEHGQILGTPEYMSPEQAEMGALDIDTRTDVYALGVMLYELLSGALPFEPKDLRSRGYNEIQRIIREVDPPKPSHRLRSLGGEKSADIARRRQAKIDELEGQLRRELEWIPLKAMRKDRDGRYPTPMAMADDVRNHLAGRPLVAGPESVMYRAKKFVYRNRWSVSAAAMVAVALTLGAIVSSIGFYRAARNAELYRQASERATLEAKRLRYVNNYHVTLLANSNPYEGERKDVTVRELLDVAVQHLDNGAQPDKRVEAALRASIAQTYRSLNIWDKAEKQWQLALQMETEAAGDDTPEAAYALAGLGQVQLDTHKLDAAEKSFRAALSVQREQLPNDDPALANTINNLGLLTATRGDFQGAIPLYREAMSIYEKRPEAATGLADAMTNLANVYSKLGQPKEAIPLADAALDIRRKRYGEKHIDVWHSLIITAQAREAEDDLDDAERLRRQALALAGQLVEEKSRPMVQSLQALARSLWLRGGNAALDEARQLQSRGIELATQLDGKQSVTVASGMDILANIERDRGQLDRAVELFRQVLALRQSAQSAEHPDTAGAMNQLADALTRAGQAPEAVELARRALEIRRKVFPAGHWSIWSATSVLGGAYAGLGDFTQAEPLLLEAQKGLEDGEVRRRRPRVDAAGRLVTLYEKWGKPAEAQKWRQQVAQLTGSAPNRP
jgi:serine/threonine protein kinase